MSGLCLACIAGMTGAPHGMVEMESYELFAQAGLTPILSTSTS
jgi:hypothetical protein